MNSNERTEYIYVLLDGNNHIFYCGRTYDLDKRLKGHLEESLAGGSSAKCRHIRDLLERGDQIKIKQVDQAPASEIAELEAFWIDKLDCHRDPSGYWIRLVNGNAGSRGPHVNDVETREKIQQWKRKKRQRKPIGPIQRKTPFDQEQYDEIERLYETDRARFNSILAARREQERERAKQERETKKFFENRIAA